MIREASTADVDALVALINGAFLVERLFVDGDRTSAADVRARLTAGYFLVAAGRGAGLDAAVYLEPRGDRAYLGMLSVSPAEQGRGLGRAMLETAEAWCRARGCHAVDILVVNIRTELFPSSRWRSGSGRRPRSSASSTPSCCGRCRSSAPTASSPSGTCGRRPGSEAARCRRRTSTTGRRSAVRAD